MFNQAVLVGRIVKEPNLKDTDYGKVCDITLAVQRSFKNANGEYDVDFITCVLWKGVAENTVQYCKKGDLIGVKGRIQSDSYKENGENKTAIKIIAEKITFLSSKTQEDENTNENGDELER